MNPPQKKRKKKKKSPFEIEDKTENISSHLCEKRTQPVDLRDRQRTGCPETGHSNTIAAILAGHDARDGIVTLSPLTRSVA